MVVVRWQCVMWYGVVSCGDDVVGGGGKMGCAVVGSVVCIRGVFLTRAGDQSISRASVSRVSGIMRLDGACSRKVDVCNLYP